MHIIIVARCEYTLSPGKGRSHHDSSDAGCASVGRLTWSAVETAQKEETSKEREREREKKKKKRRKESDCLSNAYWVICRLLSPNRTSE